MEFNYVKESVKYLGKVAIVSYNIIYYHTFCSSTARGVVILFPTLGLSWGFGVAAIQHDALVWKYLFAIFTSLQVNSLAPTERYLGENIIHSCLQTGRPRERAGPGAKFYSGPL